MIGLNHNHIYGQVDQMLKAGASLASFYSKEPDLAAEFLKTYPQARRVNDPSEIYTDPSLQLVVSAAIPNERAGIGINAMLNGKDFMVDKPGFTTLEQVAEARRVQAETGRIYSIFFSERFTPSTVRAGELVRAGAIGQVIQTIGLGPHRANLPSRPGWFFNKEQYGGILVDIASHQIDQFLDFTGSTGAEIISSQVANYAHPEHPALEDFGDLNIRSEKATGYIRVDWFTPNGLPTWGDGRIFLLGTEGYIELRKYLDIGGRSGSDHLFLADQKEVRYIACQGEDYSYGKYLVNDILNRTETAIGQEHCFVVSELAIKAENQAVRLGNLKEAK